MSTLSNLSNWIAAVFEHWHGWVSGSVIAFGLELGEHLWHWTPRKKLYIGILAIGVFVSMFYTWQDQYNAAITSQRDLENLKNDRKLDFGIALDQTSIGRSPAGVVVIIGGAIINKGAPSSVHAISLNVTLANGNKFSVIPSLIPNGFQLHSGSQDVTLNESDNLVVKLGSLMQRGEARPGSVMFVLPPGVEEKDLKEASYTLSCRDYLDETFFSDKGTFPSAGAVSEFKIYP
jgi:hypothetical protein